MTHLPIWHGFDKENQSHQLLSAFLMLDIQCAPSQLTQLQKAVNSQQGGSSGNAYEYQCTEHGIFIEPLYDEDPLPAATLSYSIMKNALAAWLKQCNTKGCRIY